jgi:hypothetical protein
LDRVPCAGSPATAGCGDNSHIFQPQASAQAGNSPLPGVRDRHRSEPARATCSMPRSRFQTAETRLRILAADHARGDVGSTSLLDEEGAGKAGCRHAPMVPCAVRSTGAGTTGVADHPAFPAQWVDGLYVISSVTMLGCHRRLADFNLRDLSACIGAPGPHDFADRVMSFVA